MQYTFHATRIASITNVWQRRFMKVVIVPEGVEEIHDCFEGCDHLRRLVLPASLKSMSPMGYFPEQYKRVTICAPTGSYAEAWAKENGHSFEVLEKT